MNQYKVYLQEKDTRHTNKEGLTLVTRGAVHKYEAECASLDDAYCMAAADVPNGWQRILIPIP